MVRSKEMFGNILSIVNSVQRKGIGSMTLVPGVTDIGCLDMVGVELKRSACLVLLTEISPMVFPLCPSLISVIFFLTTLVSSDESILIAGIRISPHAINCAMRIHPNNETVLCFIRVSTGLFLYPLKSRRRMGLAIVA